jgi:hypothetical protein
MPYGSTYVASVDGDLGPTGPAIVETSVSPSKAEVVLDGEDVGFASDYNGRWDRLTVTPGRHTISFSANGYRTLVVEFEAHPGGAIVFRDELSRGEGEERRPLAPAAAAPSAPAMGRLRVRVEPADAAVYLDGAYLGVAGEIARMHGPLPVAVGSHHVEAMRPGYAPGSRTVDVAEAAAATVELTLSAAP